MTDTIFEMNDKGDVLFLHADMREALKALPENSVDSVVTDPPYHLQSIHKRFAAKGRDETSERYAAGPYGRHATGFMGKLWDGGDIAFQVDTWREVMRVLKPGGHLAAFGGTRTSHRMACAIEDAGFEIRDTLMWCYSTGFPKSHDVSKGIDKAAGAEGYRGAPRLLPNGREHHFNIGFGEGEGYDAQKADRYTYVPATDAAREWQGWGTSLKPALEPVILARKPLSEKTVAANVLRWRTGAINIDGCRVEVSTNDLQDMTGRSGKSTPNNVYGKNINGGGIKEGTWNPNRQGRWPANLIHDGSDEVVAMFPSSSVTGKRSDKSKEKNVEGTNWLLSNHKSKEYPGDFGSAARFFYAAKASRVDRAGSRHPTVKPISLMRWLTRLITPPGGLVLDPFAGSGTTGAAALEEGMRCLLIEREAEYADDIRRRLSISDIGLI